MQLCNTTPLGDLWVALVKYHALAAHLSLSALAKSLVTFLASLSVLLPTGRFAAFCQRSQRGS